MIRGLITWATRNTLLVLLGAAMLCAAGVWAAGRLPLDALPDLSDTQVIVYTEYPGQAPQVVEDQVTTPLTSAMLTVPRSRVVRGLSFFGASYIYVVFEDGTDLYWARSRVLEYLNAAASRLPAGARPALGPDATGIGWVYQYAIIARDLSLAELRSIQDWRLRYALARAEGVAEVASIGGFVKQYNVVVDPLRLRALGLTLERVRDAIRASNSDVGGRSVELSEFEFMVRGRGYLRSTEDIERIVLRAEGGAPLLLGDVARVELGPDERRGFADLDGQGEVAGGIVLQRLGANALEVIRNVKARLAEVAPSLPTGVEIRAVYDRSALILGAVSTLQRTLIEEALVVALVTAVFLFHLRSALVAVVVLPVGVLAALVVMKLFNIPLSIMSLGGIAIAVGAMVDAAIVMVENAHKHLERAAPGAPRGPVVVAAAAEVGPALFFSLLVVTVSFLPVFALEDQEGRLFGPLAATKSLVMAAAAFLSLTLVPVLMLMLVRGRVVAEHRNPVNRLLIWLYRPVIRLVLRARVLTVLLAVAMLGATAWPAARLGGEFMPALDEGTLLFMPTTLPGLSVTRAVELLQLQDRIIHSFPEVDSVYGKAGRANTATDPAPTEMFETVIQLKPREHWRPGMTTEALVAAMDRALQFPGVSNAWTMPIAARVNMLSTGIRTPVGVKVFGPDLTAVEEAAKGVEAVLRTLPGTSSAYAERLSGGYYLDVVPDRDALARYGLLVGDMQSAVAAALGGESVTTVIEGRERYAVNVRYPRDLRDDPEAMAREVQLALPGGGSVPLGEVATLQRTRGATAIRTENGQLAGFVFVDVRGRDLRGYVAEAQRAVAEGVRLPPGTFLAWSGQFEALARAEARLQLLVPLTLVLIFVLLYLHFRRATEALVVMLSVPFALIGGVWLLWWCGANLSVAVAVGFIALAGLAAETGVVMLFYLDQALEAARARLAAQGRPLDRMALREAIIAGAVGRVRPKMMTATAIMAGLVPMLWSTGTGAEVMSRIAIPMVGGMVSSTLLTLVVIPALYAILKGWRLPREVPAPARPDARVAPAAVLAH
ncbi:efflux RND transporter permease subunit [Roseomonas sp. BN140053]|uniref:efflux RND transporter permease subunit n=1 Tax=Roseomonas sp. BN140053 TaxID=3391898 RepID=UPI0039EC7141